MGMLGFLQVLTKTCFFYIFGVAWVALCAYALAIPVALIELLLGRKDRSMAKTVLYYGTGLAGLPLRLMSDFRVDHSKVTDGESVVVVCNHHSYIDIFLLLTVFPRICFTARQSLFRIPVLGWAMSLLGHVPHDAQSLDFGLERAKGWLLEGHHLGVFPEGTRSPEGEIGKFRRGAFRIAMDVGARIQPVVVVGTGRVWSRGQFWILHLGPVGLRVLESQLVPSGLSRSELGERIEQIRQRMVVAHRSLARELGISEGS